MEYKKPIEGFNDEGELCTWTPLYLGKKLVGYIPVYEQSLLVVAEFGGLIKGKGSLEERVMKKILYKLSKTYDLVPRSNKDKNE